MLQMVAHNKEVGTAGETQNSADAAFQISAKSLIARYPEMVHQRVGFMLVCVHYMVANIPHYAIVKLDFAKIGSLLAQCVAEGSDRDLAPAGEVVVSHYGVLREHEQDEMLAIYGRLLATKPHIRVH